MKVHPLLYVSLSSLYLLTMATLGVWFIQALSLLMEPSPLTLLLDNPYFCMGLCSSSLGSFYRSSWPQARQLINPSLEPPLLLIFSPHAPVNWLSFIKTSNRLVHHSIPSQILKNALSWNNLAVRYPLSTKYYNRGLGCKAIPTKWHKAFIFFVTGTSSY